MESFFLILFKESNFTIVSVPSSQLKKVKPSDIAKLLQQR